MASSVSLSAGAASSVPTGGVPVIVVYGGVQGAIIWNPATASDQGLAVPELLYLDPTKPATLFENLTCIALFPGQFYFVPPGDDSSVWVNASTGGHKFSSIVIQPAVQLAPTSIVGVFPPLGPTGLTTTLPSYLYQEYTDDDSLQAFVMAYNSMTQEYVDWFNSINLPIYTQPQIYGLLLDWVAAGIYGITRPVLSSGKPQVLGPYNTHAYNTMPAYNMLQQFGPLNVSVTSDDVFKRIITWHFYKGDGKAFDVRWLKRRTARFLFGASGTDYEGNTYQISVSFGPDNQLNITILSGISTVTAARVYNYIPGIGVSGSYYNKPFSAFNSLSASFAAYAIPALAFVFKEAIDTGALELPFQYAPAVVNIYPKGVV